MQWIGGAPQETARGSNGAVRWYAAGEPAEVAGITISDGLIYVGSSLPSRSGAPENCLINPELKVAPSHPDLAGETMPFWPSYSEITPNARLAYLQWLAGGKLDPGASIGFVFLYLYGLERRLFVDRRRDESDALTAEVERLLNIYGSNRSFCGYARAFLEGAALFSGKPLPDPELSPALRDNGEVPLSLRVSLGRTLLRGENLQAGEALKWLMSSALAPRRTPVDRCFDEFVALWEVEFETRFPGGLRVSMPGSPLVWRYRSASGTFETALSLKAGGRPIPDITALSAPLDQLARLAEECMESLAAYSRFLGRNPGAAGSVQGAYLLPPQLLASARPTSLHLAVEEVRRIFEGRQIARTTVGALRSALGASYSGAASTAADIQAMADLLGHADIGFEPDPRFGSLPPSDDGILMMFASRGGAPVPVDDAEYDAMRTVVEVSALAAAADGVMTQAELSKLRQTIRATSALGTAQRLRLLAYAAALWRDAPKQRRVLSRLSDAPDPVKETILDVACAVAMADGVAEHGEIRFLENVAKALGKGPKAVHERLHRDQMPDEAPVMIAPARPESGTPVPPQPAAPGLFLDRSRLHKIEGATKEVHAMLSEIFVDDEMIAQHEIGSKIAPDQDFKGLDSEHSQLLRLILDRNGASREEFALLSKQVRLLPDGALDRINEWALETFDESILEDDDPIIPVEHLRVELMQSVQA